MQSLELTREEKSRRIALTADADFNRRFRALAEFDGKKPATLATEILRDYMQSRAADIDSVLQARANYEKKIDELRGKKSAAPDDESATD